MAAATFDYDIIAGDAVARRLTLGQMRRRKLLSANELGKHAKVAASTILAIEAGAKPRLRTIDKLSKALGCEPDEIEWPGDPLGLAEDEG